MVTTSRILRLAVFAVWVGISASSNVGAASFMYWTAERKVQRAGLDGSGLTDLVLMIDGNTQGLALDLTNGHVYYGVDNGIHRARLDGSDAGVIILNRFAMGIALDGGNGHLYFADNVGPGKIWRANLDGTGVTDLVTIGGSYSGIALDLVNNHMYWTDAFNDRVQRANLDGSDVTTLVTGLGNPIDIKLDVANGNMYVSDIFHHSIRRANLDGSGVTNILTGLSNPRGMALDLDKGHLYWSDFVTGKISRANLDGSGRTDVVTGLSRAWGLGLQIDPDPQPPVAVAGLDQAVVTGQTVQLDGSGSNDPNGDPLTFSWTIASRPAGSASVLSGATTVNPTFVADVAGVYVVELSVNDGGEQRSRFVDHYRQRHPGSDRTRPGRPGYRRTCRF